MFKLSRSQSYIGENVWRMSFRLRSNGLTLKIIEFQLCESRRADRDSS